MDVTTRKHGQLLVVHLNGRLDSNTSPTFEKQLLGSIQAGEKHLVMDFANLSYISSAGLRVLLMAAKRTKAAKGSIALCGMSKHITEVFTISGFKTIFPIYQNVEAAIASAG